ncbi:MULTISPECIES: efflux RND transporter periplasmic adaptor subunit [unclassified Sulfitobacter]|jgi:multidrug efflux system membrane fusion protein|uniref:efflux RND transporter periplasmic adaptor subunit n=2 Tax=Sulfitobacter TaxID=60136 RepID=UPI0007C34FF5|nr:MULTISPECIES: efflux RND transporter periplasmic adaptor subunit [unclassified Sulfitobacter]KZX91988.1 efflux transporter periplasmic adaptor subunit [Sulfitobacter sp. HI0021]KZX96417.1 efflux transporter periplasmic adaptor subunit [Sulfitobacter sp. HI0027]
MSDTSQERQTLSFESDAGSKRSKFIAGGIALLIGLWMGSGYIIPSEETEEAAPAPLSPEAVTVAVRGSQAKSVTQVFVAEGQALPDRDTMVRAEAGGEIAEVLVAKGDVVDAGALIARLSTTARDSDLARAREELSRAQREYDNAEALLDRGVSTVDRVSQARATLAAAQASVTSAEEALNNTEIRAPFPGRLEMLDISAGEFVSTGEEIARLVDNTPLTIQVQVPQQSLKDIKEGQSAEVVFITGTEAQGKVQFVSSSASAETRTFTAEVRVENADGAIPAGISARVRIPTGETRAHFVSPAILSLDTNGTLGVKTVNDEDKVVFNKIAIVRAQTDGIWIAGLPDEAEIITIGQGFVNDGETVNPQPETGTDSSPEGQPITGVPEIDELEEQPAGDGQITGRAEAAQPEQAE